MVGWGLLGVKGVEEKGARADLDASRLVSTLAPPDSRSTLLEYCRFAEEHDLHLVSDEIYGLSVFDNPAFPAALPFTSMLSLDVEKELGIRFDRARVHGESRKTFFFFFLFWKEKRKEGTLTSSRSTRSLFARSSQSFTACPKISAPTVFASASSSPSPTRSSSERSRKRPCS